MKRVLQGIRAVQASRSGTDTIEDNGGRLIGVIGSGLRAYGAPCAIEVLALLANTTTMFLAAQLFSVRDFGDYAVARRVTAIAAYPLLLGLGISLARQVARERDGGIAWLKAAVLIGISVLAVASAAVWLTGIPLATVLFLPAGSERLEVCIAAGIAATYLHIVAAAYLRGRLQLKTAGFLQLGNLGVLPLIALYAGDRDPAGAILMASIAALCLTAATLAASVRSARAVSSATSCAQAVRSLLIFGVPRVPGEFALFGLFSLPVLVVANSTGVEDAGYISLALSILQCIGGGFATIGGLTLAPMSRMASEGRFDALSRAIRVLLYCGVAAASAAALACLLLGAAGSWFGTNDVWQRVSRSTGYIAIGCVPYVTYLLLRNPLDALSGWPHNSVNLCIALATMLGVLLSRRPDHAMAAYAVSATLWLLGVLSIRSWRRELVSARAEDGELRTYPASAQQTL
jgi:O-antigen/teichoic acid export membrane protein